MTVQTFLHRHSGRIFVAAVGVALAFTSGKSDPSGRCALIPDQWPSLVSTARAADAPALTKMPAWELKDVNGKTVKSSEFAGKVVILDFWATWCPPCRAEIPGFIALQKKYASQGVVVIGVAMDDDGAAAVKPFIKKQKTNYQIVLGDENIAHAFGGIEGLPTTFIIDRQGAIRGKHVGLSAQSEFEHDLKPLL